MSDRTDADFFPGNWVISKTDGVVVQPFAPGRVVDIAPPVDGLYTVSVIQGGSYPGFQLVGGQLEGTAEGNALQIAPLPPGPHVQRRIAGRWNPLANTEGTWTGNGGGGGGEEYPKPKARAKSKLTPKPKAKPKAKAAKGRAVTAAAKAKPRTASRIKATAKSKGARKVAAKTKGKAASKKASRRK